MVNSFSSAPRVAQMTEYFFALASKKIAEVQRRGLKVINLGMGSPDLPPAQPVIEELQKRASDVHLHSYPSYYGLPQLREAISQWYQDQYHVSLDPGSMILPTAGSKEGIIFLTMALAGAGDQVLIPNPGYSSYQRAAVISGAEPIEYFLTEEQGYFPNLDELAKTDLSKVKLMWINYPHNPTGAVASLEQLTSLVHFAKTHNIVVASDAPYSHITYDGFKAVSILQVEGALDTVVELNSFSKTYNMAGWRLGWAVGNQQIISYLTTLYSNIETGVFLPIQYAAVQALKTDQSWIDQRNQVYAERRTVVLDLIQTLGATAFTSPASLYVWAKLPSDVVDTEQFCFALLEKTGVFVAPGTAFGSAGEGYIRVSICQPVELLREAIERVS